MHLGYFFTPMGCLSSLNGLQPKVISSKDASNGPQGQKQKISTNASINISFNFIEILFRPRCNVDNAIFGALFVTSSIFSSMPKPYSYNNYDHHMSVIYYWTEWHTIHSICMLASVYTRAGTFWSNLLVYTSAFCVFWQMKDWKVKIPWAVLLLKWLCGRRTGGTELKEQRNRYIYFKMFALSINSAWSPLPLMTGEFLI